jgi:protein TonB
MVRSLPRPSVFAELDAKRIAGTSLAISLHLAVLALLLVPTRWTPPERPAPMQVVVPDLVRPEPLPPMPPPPDPVPQVSPRQPSPAPTPQNAQTPVTETAPVVDGGTEVALPSDLGEPADSYDPGPPALATLAYDVHPAPRYPRPSLRAAHEGKVVLRVLVDAQGLPQDVLIESSSGHRALDKAARDQVLAKWRFHPATAPDGRRIAAWALVPIEFNLP